MGKGGGYLSHFRRMIAFLLPIVAVCVWSRKIFGVPNVPVLVSVQTTGEGLFSPRVLTIDRLSFAEMCTEKLLSTIYLERTSWLGPVVNCTNIGTGSEATLGELLVCGIADVRTGFPERVDSTFV